MWKEGTLDFFQNHEDFYTQKYEAHHRKLLCMCLYLTHHLGSALSWEICYIENQLLEIHLSLTPEMCSRTACPAHCFGEARY
jgi:hypothetical protein